MASLRPSFAGLCECRRGGGTGGQEGQRGGLRADRGHLLVLNTVVRKLFVRVLDSCHWAFCCCWCLPSLKLFTLCACCVLSAVQESQKEQSAADAKGEEARRALDSALQRVKVALHALQTAAQAVLLTGDLSALAGGGHSEGLAGTLGRCCRELVCTSRGVLLKGLGWEA